jgi:hypothetical protein
MAALAILAAGLFDGGVDIGDEGFATLAAHGGGDVGIFEQREEAVIGSFAVVNDHRLAAEGGGESSGGGEFPAAEDDPAYAEEFERGDILIQLHWRNPRRKWIGASRPGAVGT